MFSPFQPLACSCTTYALIVKCLLFQRFFYVDRMCDIYGMPWFFLASDTLTFVSLLFVLHTLCTHFPVQLVSECF